MTLLYLIGYRGCGKTTVARILSRKLGWNWCDADDLLERRAGKDIRSLFAEEGEAEFRRRETEILRELAGRSRWVIATGGGVVLLEDNRRLLRGGKAVWLRAEPEILYQRLCGDETTASRRPDLAQGGLEEVRDKLRERNPVYAACADWTVDTADRLPEDIAEDIATWYRRTSVPETEGPTRT